VTVFAAAGDSGASDGLPGGCAHVDFPAADPLVVGCGGTLLQASANAITSETVWNDPGDGATGGGVSRKFPVPAYQASINPVNLNPPHRPGRGVPDVSGNASPVSGYQVLVDGQGMVIGGTSAVAPLWAAIVARLQQQLGHPVAPLHAAIYAAGNAFRDITVGNNGGYSALSGWDACTGLGSPNGTALLTALGGSGGGGAGNGGSGGAGNGGGGEENGGAGGGEEPANPQKPARGRQRSAQEKTE
jgi:kumamolisin